MSQNNGKRNGKKNNSNWIIKVSLWTFTSSLLISLISTKALNNVSMILALVILAVIIAIGVLFDMIGIAVTAADEKPFHAMASKKIKSASVAVAMIRNADIVSNFCNDVVGDICGILSGTLAAVIVFRITLSGENIMANYYNILMTAIVATLTVGGKAYGKWIAINQSKKILYYTSFLLYNIESKLNFKILKIR